MKWKRISIVGLIVLFLIGGFVIWNRIKVVKQVEKDSFLETVLKDGSPQFLDLEWYSSEEELKKHHFTFSRVVEESFHEILFDQEIYLKDLECSGRVVCTYNKTEYKNYNVGLSHVEIFFYRETEEELYQLYEKIKTQIEEYYKVEKQEDSLVDHIEMGKAVVLGEREWIPQYWILKNHTSIGPHQFYIQQENQNNTRIGDVEKGYYLTLQLKAYVEY